MLSVTSSSSEPDTDSDGEQSTGWSFVGSQDSMPIMPEARRKRRHSRAPSTMPSGHSDLFEHACRLMYEARLELGRREARQVMQAPETPPASKYSRPPTPPPAISEVHDGAEHFTIMTEPHSRADSPARDRRRTRSKTESPPEAQPREPSAREIEQGGLELLEKLHRPHSSVTTIKRDRLQHHRTIQSSHHLKMSHRRNQQRNRSIRRPLLR